LGGNVVGADSKLGTNSGYDLIIETNNLERMRLTDAGNLGIGLNNPSSKLHLVGDFKLEGTLHIPSWTDLNDQDVRLIPIGSKWNFPAAAIQFAHFRII
jgi:diadenosine tetraphosphatase ApaH/serine/threonine PP2A family protein phosphatase